MPVGYYEVTIPSRARFKDACFYTATSGLVWAPSTDGNCDIIDPVTDTPLTPLAITARAFLASCLVDDRYIVMFGNAAVPVAGVIDTAAPGGSYTEHTVTGRNGRIVAIGANGHAWCFGSNGFILKFNPVTGVWSETAVALAGVYRSAVVDSGSIFAISQQTSLLQVDAATGTQTPRTIPAAAGTSPRECAAVSNGSFWAPNSHAGTPRMLQFDLSAMSGVEHSMVHRIENIAIAPGVGEVWFPLTGTASSIGHLDDTTGVYTTPTVTGSTSRTRPGGAFVPGTSGFGKIYCPSDGHGSWGVYYDVPAPLPERRGGTRGLGLVRGRGRF